MTFEDKGVALEQIRAARASNAIGPGLALFTGVSFLVYLLVKLAAGTVAADAGTFGQIAVSVLLFVWGLVLMLRGRFHFVTVETDEGSRRIKGLSKAEQNALMAQFEGREQLSP
jgi:hypothetical protein